MRTGDVEPIPTFHGLRRGTIQYLFYSTEHLSDLGSAAGTIVSYLVEHVCKRVVQGITDIFYLELFAQQVFLYLIYPNVQPLRVHRSVFLPQLGTLKRISLITLLYLYISLYFSISLYLSISVYISLYLYL